VSTGFGHRIRTPLVVGAIVVLASWLRHGGSTSLARCSSSRRSAFVLAARLATFAPRPLVPVVLAGAIACNVANTVWLAPHFLASASVIAGGPTGLVRALSDSNIDWGQALGELKRYMDREQIPALYLSYFGSARPSDDYGIRYQYLPSFSGEESDYLLPPSGKQIVAISVTNLQGVYLGDSDLYAWLPTSALFAVAGTPGPPGRRGIQGETGDALT